MSKPFFARMKKYLESVGKVLRGEAEAASIFPNPTDVGGSRERIYEKFLDLHLPHGCNVISGGYLFNLDGDESQQMDLIVTADTCPRYDFLNQAGSGKSFACIDGTLAVASIKSTLDSNGLIDTLKNLASLPSKREIGGKTTPLIEIKNYEDWPFKIVYASKGSSKETISESLIKFYEENDGIPIHLRPNIIHIAGAYCIIRSGPNGEKTRSGKEYPPNTYIIQDEPTDVFALNHVVQQIQRNVTASKHIMWDYAEMINGIPF